MAKDPAAVLAAFRQGVSTGGTKYQTGVKSAGTDWEQNAKSDASEAAYAAGVQNAISQKSRQKGLANVTGAQWANTAADIGARNYTGAAERAAQNYAVQLPNVLTAGDAAKAAARALPGATIAERLQRGPAAAAAVHRTWARIKGQTPQV
jgi:hypothetical protein